MISISCSIVIYHNPVDEIKNAIRSFLSAANNALLYLVDNSGDDSLRFLFESYSPQVKYVYNGRNLGYGAAHNIAINKILDTSKFHLVLNPDVAFDSSVLTRLEKFMETHSDIGLVMPKVLYPTGEMQHLCKMLPSPAHLFLRRFIPNSLKHFFKKTLDRYELKNRDYNAIMETPNLSGCFMFIRTDVFNKVGMFDERYFLYLEDTDLCRRINEWYRTLYYPKVSIVHDYSKGSYKSFKLMKLHLKSSVKYFNKWGWFNDRKRMHANAVALSSAFRVNEKVPVFANAGGGRPEPISIDMKMAEKQLNLN